MADCTRALELDPQSALAFANRGAAHLNKGDLDDAIADCTRALELAPQSALAFANRGAAYFQKGDFDRAIADCSQAVANDPALALAYLNRAAAFLAKGDSDGTIADCNQALRLNPALARAYALRGVASFNKGDDLAAIEDADEALRHDPRLAFVYGNRGLAHLRLGQVEKALQDFNEAIEHEPKLAIAYAYRGAIYLHRGKSNQAIADCNRALELEPKLALAYWNRSLAYARQGNYTTRPSRSEEGGGTGTVVRAALTTIKERYTASGTRRRHPLSCGEEALLTTRTSYPPERVEHASRAVQRQLGSGERCRVNDALLARLSDAQEGRRRTPKREMLDDPGLSTLVNQAWMAPVIARNIQGHPHLRGSSAEELYSADMTGGGAVGGVMNAILVSRLKMSFWQSSD